MLLLKHCLKIQYTFRIYYCVSLLHDIRICLTTSGSWLRSQRPVGCFPMMCDFRVLLRFLCPILILLIITCSFHFVHIHLEILTMFWINYQWLSCIQYILYSSLYSFEQSPSSLRLHIKPTYIPPNLRHFLISYFFLSYFFWPPRFHPPQYQLRRLYAWQRSMAVPSAKLIALPQVCPVTWLPHRQVRSLNSTADSLRNSGNWHQPLTIFWLSTLQTGCFSTLAKS